MSKNDYGDCRDDAYPPIYELPPDGELKKRFDILRKKFVTHFKGEEPQVYFRVPGRVNLIGEHIDYCGFSVCPMAIQQDIILAASLVNDKTSNFIELTNLDSEKYGDYSSKTEDFEIDLCRTGWASYFLCGVRGAFNKLEKENLKKQGIRAAVSGSVLPGAGLSSSSALVSAAFLATAHINGLHLNKKELASLSAESEQFVGMMGGGMDQAIAFLATKGCAKHIEFSPLATEDVMLPEGSVFVIAHSMITMNKAATADYNTRVVECRLASQILAKNHSLDWPMVLRLARVRAELGYSLEAMIDLVQQMFHEEPYTKKEVCKELGVSEDELNRLSLTENTKHIKEFKLRQRALHVFQEAWRVGEWKRGCSESWSLDKLGKLMTESHISLKNLYQCSHSELDRLVDVCNAAGAKGARLTGAGWGGCVVALSSEDKVEEFITRVRNDFYHEGGAGRGKNSLVFASKPSQGAEIYKLSGNKND